jgi:hypothetical protein
MKLTLTAMLRAEDWLRSEDEADEAEVAAVEEDVAEDRFEAIELALPPADRPPIDEFPFFI